LSQNEIISNKVSNKFNNKIQVYNMSPGSFNEFDKYLKTGIIKKPKVLIFSIVERNVPQKMHPYILKRVGKMTKVENLIKDAFSYANINVYLDKAFKQYSIEWIRARLNGSGGHGVPGIKKSKMFFLNGIKQKNGNDDFESTIANIKSCQRYCDSLGIQFIFLPMPNKETVYYDFVPLDKQPNFLFKLDSALQSENVPTINTLLIYNEYRKHNDKLLYHLDDTHWNANATEIISKAIAEKIKIENLLKK
jgi:alginate O-acetyltransferase complex protein AlgJ